ncbi:MAG: hypothetical protein QQN63_09580 [Nitrosopumilus sp.]
MERKRSYEFFIVSASVMGLWAIAFFAFSKRVRKEIGTRDSWTCVNCDKQFHDGWMVFASHKPDRHSRSDPMYNHPSSGEILCIDCEQERHSQGTSLGREKDKQAVNKLETVDRRTFKWRRDN